MSKKTKSPVRRDEDFEELDQQLEAAMRALESVNEKTVEVLQRVDQGADIMSESLELPVDADGAGPAAEDAAQPDAAAEV